MATAERERFDLRCLSPEHILKSFDKVYRESRLTDGKLVLITSEYYPQALWLMKEHFVRNEPMAVAFDIQWNTDAEHFWEDVFNKNMSIGLCDENSGKLIAVRGMKVIVDGDGNDADGDNANEVDERLKQGMDFMKYCDEGATFFKHFNTDVAVHFLGLCVAVQHRNKGIAAKLFDTAMKFIQYLQLPQVYVKGEGSSNFSKKIYEKFGFETLYEQTFTEYGKKKGIALKDTGEHKIYKVFGKFIKNSR